MRELLRFGYARVSTAGQDLEAQMDILRARNCYQIIAEHYTGKTTDRPALNGLIRQLSKGDTLVVTKLDRLARSTQEGLTLVTDLISKGIVVEIVNLGILDNSISGKLITTVFFAFAEFERSMILERTNEGKAIAKLSPDYREGRPKKYKDGLMNQAVSELSIKGGASSFSQVSKKYGISISTLKRNSKTA